MRIKQIVEELSLVVLTGKELLERDVSNAYCCDLLSWVMAHGTGNDIWITVQTHLNVVAVAVLLEIPCVIIPENKKVDQETLEKAEQEHIVLLSSHLTSYELAGRLYQMGIGSVN
mgnify:CR=1 FL=1